MRGGGNKFFSKEVSIFQILHADRQKSPHQAVHVESAPHKTNPPAVSFAPEKTLEEVIENDLQDLYHFFVSEHAAAFAALIFSALGFFVLLDLRHRARYYKEQECAYRSQLLVDDYETGWGKVAGVGRKRKAPGVGGRGCGVPRTSPAAPRGASVAGAVRQPLLDHS